MFLFISDEIKFDRVHYETNMPLYKWLYKEISRFFQLLKN